MKPLNEEFVASLREAIGDEAESLAAALDAAPSVAVRLNPRKTSGSPAEAWSHIDIAGEGGATQPVEWCEGALYLSSRPKFTQMPELHAGAFYVQDASSAVMRTIIERIASEEGRPLRMLDLCAAPGGKTTAALSALPEGSVMVANELMPARAKILYENLVKWGAPDVVVTSAEASSLGRLEGAFDVVLADVPCSGEGMMRKDEEARRQWSRGLTAQCAALQREIVASVLPSLRPGGRLVYSTCTFNLDENERNVKWLMEEFGLENEDTGLEGCGGIRGSRLDGVKALRFMQHSTRGEGLFVALLRKPENVVCSRFKAAKPLRPIKISSEEWIAGRRALFQFGDRIRTMSQATADITASLQSVKGVRILGAGVAVGEVKGKDIVPSTHLALSEALRQDAFASAELDRETALSYLRHEAIALPPDTPRGFVVVRYRGLPLGFVKNLGNRANNLYPKEWKILTK